MAKALVVVESPAKAKTINKYLGRDYKVVASMGHIRDLPKSKLGVDIEKGFAEDYETIPARQKVIKALKDAAKDATTIYVATDPDREGEAIGWHLAEELAGGGKGSKKRKIQRLMFNEITKKAVLEALKHPGTIDEKMVDAQRARRVLDRLVGYQVSPLLWDKVRRGLSAGRVQSVALKLVCDREKEIERFVPEEYWHLFARLAGHEPPEFEAKLLKKGTETAKVSSEADAKAILADLDGATFVVDTVTTRERKRNAAPPFITSKLQQAARFPVKKTMMLAQQLYEGIELPGEGLVGLITYMRTDSTRVSEQALDEVRQHIGTTYGPEYVPEKPNFFKTKAGAQDAHEAIRPTSMAHDPEKVRPFLTPDQYSLYRLIWNRFVASQMPPATADETTVDIGAGGYTFRVKGSVPKFPGWLAAYGQTAAEQTADAAPPSDADEDGLSGVLPPLAKGERLELKQLRPEQKFTQPPARYSEATLVKELEENGIGRPSTYASILGTLQDRNYVEKLEGRFKPTLLGRMVIDLLAQSFDDILDVQYTAKMEEHLDEIEEGRTDYKSTLVSFYDKFRTDLDRAKVEMENIKVKGKPTDEVCEKCGSPMVIKVGQFGPFLACSAYPDCTNTRELEKTEPAEGTGEEEIEPCENCGRPMVVKRGRFGQFLACSGYPECKTTRKLIATKQGLKAAKPDQILDEKCPRCGANLVIKHGRFGEFTACSKYPECKYVKLKSTGVACPKDGGDIVERKSRRGKVFFGCANYPDCDFTLWNRPIPEKCPTCGAPFLVEKITKKHGRQLVCQNEDCDYARSEELVEA
ncbi:MAG: type I DNA topoisomerase [Acidobacteriota bacterium]|nr:type I DNA topoisomerase [Acidobacteriota bacterium]